jgi:DNA-directed RNA polymerase I subunit RPA2
MYSGITGQEFKADIYLGLVYYQRLRHMVNDKFQVRTEGKIDQLTRQPVKGRKKGGGVRFGEMERDALLAHGTSFLLQDRLLNCSDWSTAWVCRDCGSMISLGYDEVGLGSQVFGLGNGQEHDPTLDSGPGGEYCRLCRNNDEATRTANKPGDVLSLSRQLEVLQRKGRMALVVIPFVFRCLLAELAAMGVKLALAVD